MFAVLKQGLSLFRPIFDCCSHCCFQQRETTTGCIHRLILPLVQKKLEETGEFTNQVPDINLSEVTGIWELSGLVPTCDAEASSVHTLWFSEKITGREKEVEREGSSEQIFLFLHGYHTKTICILRLT